MEKISPSAQLCINAMRELLQSKMISRISVQDILNATGISKATFYRHFSDKYDLFEKMLARDADNIFNDYCELDQWQGRIRQWVEAVRQDGTVYLRMVRHDENAFVSFYTNLFYTLLLKRYRRISKKASAFSPELHARSLFLSAGVAALLRDWIACGFQPEPSVFAGTVIRLITDVAQRTELNTEAARPSA